MSTAEGSGNIVTNGLVLYLDAANPKSYLSGSTIWNDLSYGVNNGTLVNGPTFNSANGGSIVFDGSNDYVDFYAPNLGTTTTVEMWCKPLSLTNGMFFGWRTYDVWASGGIVGFNTGVNDIYGMSSTTVTNLGLLNNWKHYVFEMRSDVSYTNNKIYINAENQILSQQRGSELAINRNFNNGLGRIGSWIINANFFMSMNCASFKVYNRALTTSEILQNFNATKGRFGL
jgi:hypothetical protein